MLYHLAAVGARDGSCNSYEIIRLAIRLIEKSKDNNVKRDTMPFHQMLYGHQCSNMIQRQQWFNFRKYKKTGVMIEDGCPSLKQALGTETPGKDCRLLNSDKTHKYTNTQLFEMDLAGLRMAVC